MVHSLWKPSGFVPRGDVETRSLLAFSPQQSLHAINRETSRHESIT